MALNPIRVVGMGLLVAGSVLLPSPGKAQTGGIPVTCTNPASGARWTISIDYDKRTVDSNPAQISDSEISWRGAQDGGTYTPRRAPAVTSSMTIAGWRGEPARAGRPADAKPVPIRAPRMARPER